RRRYRDATTSPSPPSLRVAAAVFPHWVCASWSVGSACPGKSAATIASSLLRSPWLRLSTGCVEGDRGTDERLERTRVDVVPLMDVNRAPGVSLEAGVEERGRVRQRGPLREGQFHDGLVRLAGADDAVMRP